MMPSITTMPLSVTWYFLRSLVQIVADLACFGHLRTFLSRMARRILACRPMSQLSKMTESSTDAPVWTRTPRPSTDVSTTPPERMQPPETMESIACLAAPSPHRT